MLNQKQYQLVLSADRSRHYVFDPNGVKLGTVEIPRREYPVRADDGVVLGNVLAPEQAIRMLRDYEEERRRH